MASKLTQMQARFQKKQLQEKEERLLKLYENQQQRAIDRIGKTAGSVNNSPTTNSTLLASSGGGKVRQMFDERRQKAGIDRSYPLEPLKQENIANMVAVVPSKTGLRGANSKKIAAINTLTTRPCNGIYTSKASYRQRVAHTTIIGNVTSHVDQQDVVDNMNKISMEDDMNDNKILTKRAHMEQAPTVLNGVDGKLSNLGGKLPSEIIPKTTDQSSISSSFELYRANGLKDSNNVKKEIKTTPLLKRATNVKPAGSPIGKLQTRPPSVSSSSSSMSKPQSRSGPPSSARSAPPRAATTPSVAGNDRTPNTQRPSTKQTPRGPSAVQRDDLDECRYCHRRFAGDRLPTHEDICARTAKKKRKQYDATKHRLEGTELSQFTTKPSKNTNVKGKASSSKVNSWRQKHEEFIASIRSAKMAQQYVAKGGKLSDLPPPPPSTNPDYVQCPHCGRRFNESAAERHIPKCASYDYNKSKAGPNRSKAR